MSKNLLSLAVLFFMGIGTIIAQNKTVNFEVNGKCNMCKSRIEQATKSIDGVISASWNVETKMASVEFDSTKTNAINIQSAIAKAGHDTHAVMANNESYQNLPACCQYDRNSMSHDMKMNEKSACPHGKQSSGSCCKK